MKDYAFPQHSCAPRGAPAESGNHRIRRGAPGVLLIGWRISYLPPGSTPDVNRVLLTHFQEQVARQMLEHAIETGRGGVFLRLTPEQYARLRGAVSQPP